MVVVVIVFLLLLDKKDSIATLWILLGLYVAFAILHSRDTKQRQSLFTRLPHVGAMIVAFVLLLERRAYFGPLERRFLPDSQTLDLDWDRPDGLWNRSATIRTMGPLQKTRKEMVRFPNVV